MQLGPYLQAQGISRRKIIDAFVQRGVMINEQYANGFRDEIYPGDQIVIYMGEVRRVFDVIETLFADQKLVLFHKPRGYIVSHSDGHNPTIFSLLPDEYRQGRYFVGRLDLDSRGLVILTNKTDLVHKREHPRFGVPKLYRVQIGKPFDHRDKQRMIEGELVDEYGRAGKKGYGDVLRVRDVSYEHTPKGEHILSIILTEGKKRHIRRLLRFLGHRVLDLCRTHIGGYGLGNLKPGGYRCEDIPPVNQKMEIPSTAFVQELPLTKTDDTKKQNRKKRAKPKWKR